jgi:hypothetical protein
MVLLEGGDGGGIVEQDVGIQNIGLLGDGFQVGFFYAQG